MDVIVRREEITSIVAASLIAALNEELSRQYPEPGATHFRLDVNEVAEGRGAFLVAYLDGTPVGCGAVRRIATDSAEIKRMYVAPTARGQGIGKALLDQLEREARLLGVQRVVLEMGTRQEVALILYRGAGFSVIPAFGEYTGSSTSICMGKEW